VTYSVFSTRLRKAAMRAVRFARRFVSDALPDRVLFRVLPNCSFDGNPLVLDEVTFPDDELPLGAFHGPWALDDAVEFLWREGRIPEWIDVSVVAVADSATVIECRCCGRFTATEELLYHRSAGLPPFSVKSPRHPNGWLDVATSGGFTLRPNRK
jgi:hypothetical protein